MSFSSQRAVCYFVNLAIPALVTNWLYRMSAMLKRQQFEDSKSNKIKPRDSKRQRLDLRDNEEEKSLNKFKSEDEKKNIKYIPFFLLLFSEKSQTA